MDKINLKFEGENTEPHSEILEFKYRGKLKYSGWTDCFVTTSDQGELMLRLNNENDYESEYYVTAKLCGDKILWVLDDIDDTCNYSPIVFTIKELKDIWTKVGYSYKDDLDSIKPIDYRSLKLSWLSTSKVNPYMNCELEWIKQIKNEIIAVDATPEIEEKLFRIIKEEWTRELINIKPICDLEQLTVINVYFDETQPNEWAALKKDIFGNIFISIDNEILFEIL